MGNLNDVVVTKMVLDNSKQYRVTPSVKPRDQQRLKKTVMNMNRMLAGGHPITLVLPDAPLSEEAMDSMRRKYCKEAKQDKVNYIYFEVPVSVEEADPMADIMFE